MRDRAYGNNLYVVNAPQRLLYVLFFAFLRKVIKKLLTICYWERQRVRFDELFEMRKLTGIKLKDYISGNGFSKVSFCKKAEISRPTLDKILNGEIDSKSSFDKHLNKIFTSLGIGPDTLMEFSTKTQSVDAMYSQKALINYQMNDKAKMEYDLLQDILNLCSVYYQRQKAMSEQTTAANLDEVIETQMKQSESA